METTETKTRTNYTVLDVLTGAAPKTVVVETDPRDAGAQYRVDFAPNFGATTIEDTAEALLHILETTESEMRHSLTWLDRTRRRSGVLEDMVSSLTNTVTMPLEGYLQDGITEDDLDRTVAALANWLETLPERGVTAFTAWRLRLIRAVEAVEPKSEAVAAV